MTATSSVSNPLTGNTFSPNSRSTSTRVSTAELWTNYQELLAHAVAAEAKDQQTGNSLKGLSCFVSDSSNQGALQNACSPDQWAAIQARKALNAALSEAQIGSLINTYQDTGIDPYATWDSYLGKPPGSTLASVTGDWSTVAKLEVAPENGDDLTVVGGEVSGPVPQDAAPDDASVAFASANVYPASMAIEHIDSLPSDIQSYQTLDLVSALLDQFHATLKIERT